MKPARIFQQYIWLINAFRRCRRMTLEELNEQWVREEVNDGNPLPRTTFNRHRDAILDMYGVVLECDVKDHFRYYIANPEVLDDDSLERWTLSTLTVGGVLSTSASLKDRIILENVPAGETRTTTATSELRLTLPSNTFRAFICKKSMLQVPCRIGSASGNPCRSYCILDMRVLFRPSRLSLWAVC